MARSSGRRARKRGGLFSFLSASALAALLAAAAVVFVAERKLSRMVVNGLGVSFSTRIYSAPFRLREGVSPTPERFIRRLERLGYTTAARPQRPGEYEHAGADLQVWLRSFKTPEAEQLAGLYTLTYEGDRWKIVSSSGVETPEIDLEPELAAELSGPEKIRRDPAEPAEIPDALKKAVVAVEDKRFYSHWGIDLHAVARALWADVRGRPLQGGSTISQQLAKNLFLSPRRNLRRKAAEAALAIYMELRFDKDRILTLYLNEIYLGQDGPVSIMGMKSAARFYFGKDLQSLTLPECAMLGGLIRSPHRYNPFRDPAAAKARRDFVLRRMEEEGYIDERQRLAAVAQPIKLAKPGREKTRRGDDDYFVAEVVRELAPSYGEETLYTHGLRIDTTLDPLLQHEAQAAVRRARAQAALVALDPRTGRVLALVGGKDFAQSQFNRATQARRQPGSAFKPFVYAAALQKGFTAATLLDDEPRQYARSLSTGTWDPRNYEEVYFGTTTLRTALAHSLNAATLDLAQRVGMPAVLDYARAAGVRGPLDPSLATALGASEVDLLDLTAAYAPFDNGGYRVEPETVVSVSDAEGEVLQYSPFSTERVLDAALSYLMTSLLEGVVQEGTAKSLSLLGFTRPAAGKTGTTNDGRDAWFVGYTPDLLSGVWYGDDAHRRLNATGAKSALPIWAAFMRSAVQDYPPRDFERPPGLVDVVIDPASGLRARSGCPQRVDELFAEGTQPTQDCPLHVGGVRGWLQRLFH